MEQAFGNFFSALLQFIFASFIIERALSLIFETKWFIEWADEKDYIRVNIALLAGAFYAWASGFDVTVIMFDRTVPEHWHLAANSFIVELTLYIFHGAALAGGSKACLKLMKDVFQIKSFYEKERESINNKYPATSKELVQKRLDKSSSAAAGNERARDELVKDMNDFLSKSNIKVP